MNKRLIVIDGHALVHRAWHALPPLTTKDGEVVSGAYGFVMILLKAIKELKPTHVAVTFDLAGPTFRHEEYEDYKATREEKPDELYEQFPICEEILEAMDIPVYTAEGYEADDVIGTIAKRVGGGKQAEVVVVTGDKDTLQLVDDRVKVYTMRKGMTDTVLYDAAGVEEKMRIRPDQLVDYKALRGDPSDNIPGVRGIGDKGAVTLLSEYGTLENIYEHLDDIKDSLRKKLEESRDDAFMSQDLATIRQDVDLEFDFADTEYRAATREQMAEIFERYQFVRLLNQLPKADSDEGRRAGGQMDLLGGGAERERGRGAENSADEPPQREVIDIIDDAKAAKELFARFAKTKRVAFRSVTDGAKVGAALELLAMCDGTGAHVMTGAAVRGALPALKKLFAGKEIEFVCFDLKGELAMLSELEISLKGRPFDLMLASYLLHAGERRHTLESVLSFYRSVPPPVKKPDEAERAGRLVRELSHFMSLADEFAAKLDEEDLRELFDDMELPLSRVLERMERNGVRIDTARLAELSKELNRKMVRLVGKIHRLAGGEFNVNSPAQLKEVLFDRLAISTEGIKKTAKGGGLSTAAAELEKIKGEHPMIPAILDYREVMKLQSTYVDALPPLVHPKTGRIHADFNQTVTATGRLSSSNPNLQNIPTAGTEYGKKVRDAFVAPRGHRLLAADYSQVELRIAAHIADEPTMKEAFRKKEDIHWRTAVEMFGEENAVSHRRIAKAINFGILYGMGAMRLAASADISFAEARDYIDQYFALHGGIAEYIDSTKAAAAEDGYVETLFGRKRFFSNMHLMNPRERAEAERQAVNMPIQGTSADMIKLAMVELDRKFGHKYGYGDDSPVKMILQVHDELVFEVKADLVDEVAATVKKSMEGVVKLDVPVVVDLKTGLRWGEMKPL
ncbi:DNA polymerase I [Patescibacteria group bacterium]